MRVLSTPAVTLIALGSLLTTISVPALPAGAVPHGMGSVHAAAVNATWAPFGPREMLAFVPTRSAYWPSVKRTDVTALAKYKVDARSDGRTVFVKKDGKWRPVPYRYVPRNDALIYDEHLRLKLGISKDPLGAVKPTYGKRNAKWVPAAPPTDDPYWDPNDPTGGASGEPTSTVRATAMTGNTAIDPRAEATLGGNWRTEMLARVNAMRAAVGVAPLTLCNNLNTAAQGWSSWQAANNYMGHGAPDGTGPGARINDVGYIGRTYGENAAMGQTSVGEVMQGWRNSPGHYANIVKSWYKHVGFGAAASPTGTVSFTQNFAAGGPCT